MTPDACATLHARCFTTPRPWTAQEFADLLDRADIVLETLPGAFALLHDLGAEAELLTIAVDPDRQRQGLGRALLTQAEQTLVARGCDRLVLEVSAENAPAIALYVRAGFDRLGKRPNYYRQPDGTRVDALVLGKDLFCPQDAAAD